MVGHYLLTLSQMQEDRVLTERLVECCDYVMEIDGRRCGCLKAIVHNYNGRAARLDPIGQWNAIAFNGKDALLDVVGLQFDRLCHRFGEPRINAAIRNRILSNQARRALAGVREAVPA